MEEDGRGSTRGLQFLCLKCDFKPNINHTPNLKLGPKSKNIFHEFIENRQY